MSDNRYKTLLSNTAVFAIGNILVKLIAFFLMPLYTSVLTTEQYGVSELLNSTIEIILPLATVCMIEALYRFSIDKDADHKALFANTMQIVLTGDVAVAAGCMIAASVFHYQYAYSFLILYICTTFYKMTTQFARGLGHVKRYAFYGVSNSLILVFSNVILLVVLKGGVRAYLASFSIAYGVAGLLAFVLSKEYTYVSLKRGDRKQLKEMLHYSIPAIPNMISWWVNSVSDRYIVMLFWNANVVGLYTAASKLPAMINLVSSIFQQAWQYSTATEIDSKDKKSFFSTVLRGYVYICTSACAILILFNRLICHILLKTEFYVAWKFVPLLLLAAMFGCISTYFGTFYQALKSNMMLMVSTVIGAGFNIVFNFILIPKYGGFGAAIATAVSYMLVTAIRVWDVRKKIELDINWKKTALQMIPLICMTICSSFIESSITYIIAVVCTMLIVISDVNIVIEIVKKNLLRRGNA